MRLGKKNAYLIGIILSILMLLYASIKLFNAIVLSVTSNEPIVDYEIALIGFLGSVGGVLLPISLGKYNDCRSLSDELQNCINSIYMELGTNLSYLLNKDIFRFETIAWNVLKSNYVKLLSLNEDIVLLIADVYNDIEKTNEIMNEILLAKKENKREDVVALLSKCSPLKNDIKNKICTIIKPISVMLNISENNYAFSQSHLLDVWDNPNLVKKVNKLFANKNSNLDFEKTIITGYSEQKTDITNYLNEFIKTRLSKHVLGGNYRFEIIDFVSNKYLFVFYEIPNCEEMILIPKVEKNFSKTQSSYSYLDDLPSFVSGVGINPLYVVTQFELDNFDEAVELYFTNYFDKNLTNFLIYSAYNTSKLKEFINKINDIDAYHLFPIMFINAFSNFDYFSNLKRELYKSIKDIHLSKDCNESKLLEDYINRLCDFALKDKLSYIEPKSISFYENILLTQTNKLILTVKGREICFDSLDDFSKKDLLLKLRNDLDNMISSCSKIYKNKKTTFSLIFSDYCFLLNVYEKLLIFPGNKKVLLDQMRDISIEGLNLLNEDNNGIFAYNENLCAESLLSHYAVSGLKVDELFANDSIFVKQCNYYLSLIEKFKNSPLEYAYCSILIKVYSNTIYLLHLFRSNNVISGELSDNIFKAIMSLTKELNRRIVLLTNKITNLSVTNYYNLDENFATFKRISDNYILSFLSK